MPSYPEQPLIRGPLFEASDANAGGNGSVESNQPLTRFDALTQPFPLGIVEPYSLDQLKQTLGTEVVESDTSDGRKLTHITTAEDPLDHSQVTSTTVYNIIDGDKAIIESILSHRDNGTPDAFIEYTYEQPDDSHYRLVSQQTYLQVPNPTDPTAKPTRYPMEKSDFLTDAQGHFDRKVTKFEGNSELTELLFPPEPLAGGPEKNAADYIAKVRKAALTHPSYQVFDMPDGRTVVKKITVDRSPGASRPTRLNITEMTFDPSNRLETFIINDHPMRPGIDTATQTINRYTYEKGYVVQFDETYAGIRTVYTYGHKTLKAPDGRKITICNKITINGEETLDLDELRTSSTITPDSAIATFRGMFGFDTERMDERSETGKVIRRHISLDLLPADLELVVDRPRRRARMTLQRK